MNKKRYLLLHVIAIIAIILMLAIYTYFKFYLIYGANFLLIVLLSLFAYLLVLLALKAHHKPTKKGVERIMNVLIMLSIIAAAIIINAIDNTYMMPVIIIAGLILTYFWIKLIFLREKI
ncbi:MAG: hypothetical protein A2Y62_13605 [Candidatus Fischerbacteria bacterium RBG_13_37_8]|uniref:Uncharacterized protein n=1 Tax=Candidatus Fischerbacteria bacterium RBG_13_37_8 TaxID=1817863 RepID=A0A1F5V8T3_9BACT|nr:MAG: hypothetical protein A2Y62_13605 [Candidatus Fischerbacteria bacterium RBG_13_37_8]